MRPLPLIQYLFILTRRLVGNDAHDIHVGVDTGDFGLGRVAVNDDVFPSKSSIFSCR